MSVYDVLAEPVRMWIDARGWTSFSMIQAEAMPRILAQESVLLVAPTASGKTEAAVLPIVSDIIRRRLSPVAMLYIAPLKALINDQAGRVERILAETSLRTAWWHGDVSPGQRKRILRDPPHALLTTPESLEVLLSSDAYGHGALLADVQYLLVDEVHAFAESERGAQLTSLVSRLEARREHPYVRVALSATIGDPARIAEWLQSRREDAPAIVPVTPPFDGLRRIGVGLIPEVGDDRATPQQRQQRRSARLASVLTRHVVGRRSLVFTNARATAEEVTTLLRERGVETHIHHGSVDVDVRARTEALFRREGPKTIVATSTLELGIDIGDLEQSIQLGAPATASSFLQRLGRSGRRVDQESVGYLYALSEEELPVSLAIADLAREGVTEALYPDELAFSVLFQQAIQVVRERDGPTEADVLGDLRGAGSFAALDAATFADVLADLCEQNFLESVRGHLYVGARAERTFGTLNWRDFYSVFLTERSWTVKHGTETVGTIDRAFPLAADGRSVFILAGRKWQVHALDRERLIALVAPAPNAKVPRWSGETMPYSFEVMRRTCQLLTWRQSPLEHPALGPAMARERDEAQRIGLDDASVIVLPREHDTVAYTYAGFAINDYLRRLVERMLDVKMFSSGHFVGVRTGTIPLERLLAALRETLGASEERLRELEAAAVKAVMHDGALGKFGPYFGERTRTHEARHRLRRGREQFARYRARAVRIADAN